MGREITVPLGRDLAETFHLPVVYLCDCPGFLIGLEGELRGRRQCTLAFARADDDQLERARVGVERPELVPTSLELVARHVQAGAHEGTCCLK